MSTPRKHGDIIVAFTSRKGVHVFRQVVRRAPGEEPYITPRFQMRVQRGKRRVFFQLPTTVKKAGDAADDIAAFLDLRENTLDMAIAKFDPDRWAMMNPTAKVATIGDVLKAHEAAEKALALAKDTAADYRQSVVVVVRQALAHSRKRAYTDEEVKAMPLSVLTHKVFADFRVARVALAGDDKGEAEKKKRSANRTITFVKSLFSQAARRHYTHLLLPATLDDALGAARFRKVGKIRKRMPEAEVLRRLFTEAGELRKADPNAYLAFLLAAHAGFRAKEIAGARPDWVQDGAVPRAWVRTTEDFIAKSYEERFAEIQPWVFAELVALTKDRTHMLKGTKEERTDLVFRRLNAWVKARGFAEAKGEKGVHGLRFLFGAYLANRRSLYTAQKFLGHESVTTTEDHYTDLILDTSLFELWETVPEWIKPA